MSVETPLRTEEEDPPQRRQTAVTPQQGTNRGLVATAGDPSIRDDPEKKGDDDDDGARVEGFPGPPLSPSLLGGVCAI